MMFMVLCVVYSTITSLPWSLYSTFVVEERHGFNKQVKEIFYFFRCEMSYKLCNYEYLVRENINDSILKKMYI